MKKKSKKKSSGKNWPRTKKEVVLKDYRSLKKELAYLRARIKWCEEGIHAFGNEFQRFLKAFVSGK